MDHDDPFAGAEAPVSALYTRAQRGIPFRVGDILMTTSGFPHAVLWVGGERPIVHNIEGRHTAGVIRQGVDYLDSHPCDVYRYNDAAVAARAAAFAIDWATPSDDRGDLAGAFRFNETAPPTKRVLKTPFSQKRLADAQSRGSDPNPWTANALFRVIKAIARQRDGAGLSPNHGASCSQFVTYCYQAAALEIGLGDRLPVLLTESILKEPKPEQKFDLVAWNKTEWGDGSAGLWRDKAFAVEKKVFYSLTHAPDNTILREALAGARSDTERMLPKAMRADARFRTAERLLADLKSDQTAFAPLGRTKRSDGGNGEFQIFS